jgi:hypothetical protein
MVEANEPIGGGGKQGNQKNVWHRLGQKISTAFGGDGYRCLNSFCFPR